MQIPGGRTPRPIGQGLRETSTIGFRSRPERGSGHPLSAKRACAATAENPMTDTALQNDANASAAVLAALGSRSIVLVGMMGVGKSSIGRRLATRLGIPFVDADTEIEKAAGMSITDIFAHRGEADFRSGEARVIARLLGRRAAGAGGWRRRVYERRHPRGDLRQRRIHLASGRSRRAAPSYQQTAQRTAVAADRRSGSNAARFVGRARTDLRAGRFDRALPRSGARLRLSPTSSRL